MHPKLSVPAKRWRTDWRSGLVGLTLFAAGCATTGRDVSRDPQFPTDYDIGGVYVTKQARLLERTGTWPVTSLVVKPPRQINVLNAPASVAEYEANPRRWPKVAGVLPAGTRLRVLKIVHIGSLQLMGLDPIAEVDAEILDGALAGKTAEISWISRRMQQSHPASRMLWVNPAELENVGSP